MHEVKTDNYRSLGSSKRQRSTAWIVLSAAFFAAAIAVKALPDEAPQTRLCTGADLNGTYLLVDFKEIPGGRFTAQNETFPYQVLEFSPGATWSEMGFDRPPTTPEALAVCGKTSECETFRYSICAE